MSHALESAWTFYYYSYETEEEKANYEACIHKIGTVSTAEEFWAYYSHMKKPDEPGYSVVQYSMFRGDLRPMWEDEGNRNGGKFTIKVFQKDQTKYVWERLLLALIGEHLPSDVNGAICQMWPKCDVISIWHQTATDEEVKMQIAEMLRDVLKLPVRMQIEYNKHSDGKDKKISTTYAIESGGVTVRIQRAPNRENSGNVQKEANKDQ